jgi:hypothetical protein
MTDRGARRAVLAFFAVAVYLITKRELAIEADHLPWPHAYLAASLLYGSMGLAADLAPGLAAAVAGGLTIGLLYRVYGGQAANATGNDPCAPAAGFNGQARAMPAYRRGSRSTITGPGKAAA